MGFFVAVGDRIRSNSFNVQQRKFRLVLYEKFSGYKGDQSSIATGFLEKLWNPHLWELLAAGWLDTWLG